jgi:hypothetical protein
MALKADRLLFIGIICIVTGIVVFIIGPFLFIPAIIPLTVASILFLVAIITVILALCNYQRGYAQSRGRDVF